MPPEEVDADPTPIGVVLVNLGTPDAPETGAVRRYLREFLGDPRVLDTHPLLRTLLLEAVILPFRPRRSAAAYRKVWTEEGSPLLVAGRALRDGVAAALGPGYRVALGMRYGAPSLASALETLAGCARLVVAPLYPQYAEASTGSSLARLFELAPPSLATLRTVPAFYEHPEFIAAWVAVAREPLEAFRPDHVLFSYHGLPERQLRNIDRSGRWCLAREDCCEKMCSENRSCYRAQCFATSRALAPALSLQPGTWSNAFQSRVGRTPWIQPFTDVHVVELAQRGVRRLAVLCPTFVADCLETLEEVGIRLREQWGELGGEALWLAPCPNADPTWVNALCGMIRGAT